jgi:hypothetical protein
VNTVVATEEYRCKIDKKSWELVFPSELPSGCVLIRQKWIGKHKPGHGEVPTCFKWRLMAVGCAQRPGVYFEDTFAQVRNRVFLYIYVNRGCEYKVMPYFWKRLHCTKQAPMLWNKTLNGKLKAVDFQPMMDTVSIFVLKELRFHYLLWTYVPICGDTPF